MDAEKIVLGLEAMAYDLGHATSVRHKYLKYVEAGAELISLLTRPLTLDECGEILNANEHLFTPWEQANPGEWWKVDDDRLVKGEAFHTQFEAEAFARAFLLKGGAE